MQHLPELAFPPGAPLLVMCALSVLGVAGLWLAGRAPEAMEQEPLTVWMFAPSHANMIRGTPEDRAAGIKPLTEQFRERTGRGVDVQLVGVRPLDLRLVSMSQSGATGPFVPDLVEIEINSIGKYFRGPKTTVGLLPLRERLEREGLLDEMLATRVAPWTKDGEVYGIPMDVHPVGLVYRRDLFSAAGIDVDAITTWDQFHRAGLEFDRYWRDHGHPEYQAIELPRTNTSILEVMLLQRGINLIDEEGNARLNDPLTLDTFCRYVAMAAGPRSIGTEPSMGSAQWVRELVAGYSASVLAPDWRLTWIENYGPELAGKVRLRPLPLFEPGDVPTATWGGTGYAIPAGSDDPEAAWEFLRFIMFSEQGAQARWLHTQILPATPAAWDDPSLEEAHEYWSGQRVGQINVELARQVPRRVFTPFSAIASAELTYALMKGVAWVEAGNDPERLGEPAARWLADAQREVEMRIEFGRFDELGEDVDER